MQGAGEAKQVSGQAASWTLQVSLQQAESNKRSQFQNRSRAPKSPFQIEDIAYPRNRLFWQHHLGTSSLEYFKECLKFDLVFVGVPNPKSNRSWPVKSIGGISSILVC